MLENISISVREIVNTLSDPALTDRCAVPMRSVLGQRAHKDFQNEKRRYKTEFTLTDEYVSKTGVVLSVHGRIDAVEKTKDGFCVLEFKTVMLSAGELALFTSSPFEKFTMQAKIYAYMFYEKQKVRGRKNWEAKDVKCQLVAQNILCDEREQWDVEWNPDEVEQLFERFVEYYLHSRRELEIDTARKQRISDSMQWIYPDYREGQQSMLDQLTDVYEDRKNVLWEAPPGFGKTAVVVYVALKHALSQGDQLFFATAKGGGRVAINDTIRLIYKKCPELRVLFLRSREDTCPFDPKNCKESQCQYVNSVDFYNGVSNLPSELLAGGIVSIKLLLKAAEKHSICPVELGLALTHHVDLVVGDFNYIIDSAARLWQFQQNEGSEWLLVIDEAHNLFDRAIDSFSVSLEISEIDRCIELLEYERWRLDRDNALNELTEQLMLLKDCVGTMLSSVPEEGILILEDCDYDWDALSEELGLTLARFLAINQDRIERELVDCLWSVYNNMEYLARLAACDWEAFPFFVDTRNGCIGIRCLDPSSNLRELFTRFSIVTAFSGTFSPLDFYGRALGFDDSKTVSVSIPGTFDPDRRLILHIKGIDTRYFRRPENAEKIGELINQFCKTKTGSYLIVFPSYEFLNLVLPYVDRSDLELLVQERNMPGAERRRLRKALSEKNGTKAALVVAGGQFTESMDYAGESCIGIMIVGPCLPPPDFWRDEISDYWTRMGEDGSGAAYIYPAVRKIVQAAGRLIRSHDDRGVILLLDDRLMEQPFFGLLPEGWRRGILSCDDDWVEQVKNFWKNTTENDD